MAFWPVHGWRALLKTAVRVGNKGDCTGWGEEMGETALNYNYHVYCAALRRGRPVFRPQAFFTKRHATRHNFFMHHWILSLLHFNEGSIVVTSDLNLKNRFLGRIKAPAYVILVKVCSIFLLLLLTFSVCIFLWDLFYLLLEYFFICEEGLKQLRCCEEIVDIICQTTSITWSQSRGYPVLWAALFFPWGNPQDTSPGHYPAQSDRN